MTSSSSKISTAVILAAGMGIRLRNVTGLLPKGLLEIGGKSLIHRSLENLKNEDIDRAVIVTGFQESLYHDNLQQTADIPELEFVHSRQFEETGSMHSLFVAKNYLQEDFLLLESDLLYESHALPSVINFEGPDVVLASGETGSGDEVYIYGEKSDKQSDTINSGRIVSGEIAAISKKPFTDHRALLCLACRLPAPPRPIGWLCDHCATSRGRMCSTHCA